MCRLSALHQVVALQGLQMSGSFLEALALRNTAYYRKAVWAEKEWHEETP